MPKGTVTHKNRKDFPEWPVPGSSRNATVPGSSRNATALKSCFQATKSKPGWGALALALVLGWTTPAVAQDQDYRLGYGDALGISVVGQPNLETRDQAIRPDGKITLPFVQDVKAQGLTVNELTAALARAYRPYCPDAPIVVQVTRFRSLRVTVIGLVQRPGTPTFTETPTLVEAIASAGGLTDRAERHAIKVMEPGGKTMVYDLDVVLAGKQALPRVPEGSVVEVMEVWGPDMYRVLGFLSPVIAAGVYLFR